MILVARKFYPSLNPINHLQTILKFYKRLLFSKDSYTKQLILHFKNKNYVTAVDNI